MMMRIETMLSTIMILMIIPLLLLRIGMPDRVVVAASERVVMGVNPVEILSNDPDRPHPHPDLELTLVVGSIDPGSTY